MSIFKSTPRKIKTWTDAERNHFAVQIDVEHPLRVHATNGAYLFSVGHKDDRVIIFLDPTFGDHPNNGEYRVTDWENPIGGDIQKM